MNRVSRVVAMLLVFLAGLAACTEMEPVVGTVLETRFVDLVSRAPIGDAIVEEVGEGVVNIRGSDSTGAVRMVPFSTEASIRFRVSHSNYRPTEIVVGRAILERHSEAGVPLATYLITPASYEEITGMSSGGSPSFIYVRNSEFEANTSVEPHLTGDAPLARDDNGALRNSLSPGRDSLLFFPDSPGFQRVLGLSPDCVGETEIESSRVSGYFICD